MATITERHTAIVTSIDDPQKRGRIKVSCSALSGDDDVLPDFIDPVFDWGWFLIPDVGEEIEIEVVVRDAQEESAYEQAFLEEPRMTYRGKRFVSEEGDQPRPPESHFTKKNYGKRRGFATPAGHFLIFDDTDGQEMISLTLHRPAQDDYSFISFDKDGSCIISNNAGGLIYLNASGELTLIDADGGNVISAKKGDGIKLIDQYSNIVQLKNGAIQVLGQKSVVIKGGTNVTVDSNKNKVTATQTTDIGGMLGVNINSGGPADSSMVRGTQLAIYFASKLSVLTAFGPSGPAIIPLAPGVELSILGMVK